MCPLAADRDAIGTGAVERQLPALRRRVDPARCRALLRRDIADERPELERGTERQRRVTEPARDARLPPGFELAAQLGGHADPVFVEIAEHEPQIAR